MTEVQRHIPQEFPAPAEVEGAVEGIDDALEAAVVDVGNNDGEDGWISDEGEGNVNNNNDNLDDDKDDVDTNELVQNDPNTHNV
ncbi:hypothetical protein H4Q26_003380 [Puccinia striiformis f. sp. tritici PST-130]|nr:hypothetical protein H4Q26_003380 [Puccinia striiformis f. sp. tritici PST-130]